MLAGVAVLAAPVDGPVVGMRFEAEIALQLIGEVGQQIVVQLSHPAARSADQMMMRSFAAPGEGAFAAAEA